MFKILQHVRYVQKWYKNAAIYNNLGAKIPGAKVHKWNPQAALTALPGPPAAKTNMLMFVRL